MEEGVKKKGGMKREGGREKVKVRDEPGNRGNK